jgi:hypothetical protein
LSGFFDRIDAESCRSAKPVSSMSAPSCARGGALWPRFGRTLQQRGQTRTDPPIVERPLDIDASFGFCVHGSSHFGAAALCLDNVVRMRSKCNATVVFDAAVLGYPFEG